MKVEQKALAKELGVHTSTLSLLFNGKIEPSKTVAKKIANYIGEKHWGLVFEMSPREMESAIHQAHLERNQAEVCRNDGCHASA